jgi:hypothetical protein
MASMIKVGDLVRSFDFDGHEDCYVEGRVERIGYMPDGPDDCERYHVRPTRRVFGGEELAAGNIPPMVYPPLNGTLTWTGRKTDGVRKVS